MGVDLCVTLWDNPAQGVEDCELWELQYKIWELAGLIVSPQGQTTPVNKNLTFIKCFITAYLI